MEPETHDYQRIRIPLRNKIIGCVIVVLYFGLTIGGAAFAAAELTFALCDSCSWPSAAFMSVLAGWGCLTLMRYWQHQRNFEHDDEWW